jgi:hypothetical protein
MRPTGSSISPTFDAFCRLYVPERYLTPRTGLFADSGYALISTSPPLRVPSCW